MKEAKLKPCPDCGEMPVKYKVDSELYLIECTPCRLTRDGANNPSDAIKSWNTRATITEEKPDTHKQRVCELAEKIYIHATNWYQGDVEYTSTDSVFKAAEKFIKAKQEYMENQDE